MAVALGNDCCAPLVTEGYTCQFVEPTPDSLMCPVCLLPFRDPCLLSCCGHEGCSSCLDRIKASGRPCPFCQQPFDTMLDKSVKRRVLELRVYCFKKVAGCGWEGQLRHLEAHTDKDCDFVEEECRYKCGVRYQRRLLHDHETDECPQRPQEVITQCLVRKMAERIDKLEEIHNEKVAALLSTIKTVEKAYQQDQSRLNQKIQVLQEENVALQAKKAEMSKKIVELQCQHQQLIEHTNSVALQEKSKFDRLEGRCQSRNSLCSNKVTKLESSLKSSQKTIQKEQTELAAVQSKLAAIEKYGQESRATLKTVEVAHRERTGKMCALEVQLQQKFQQIQAVMVQEKVKSDELEAKQAKLLSSVSAVEKSHQKDQSKMQSLQAKVGNIEKMPRECDAKLAVIKRAHSEEWDRLRQQILQLQTEKVYLPDEAKEMREKVDELKYQMQLQSDLFLSLVPAQGTLFPPSLPCQIVMPQFSQHWSNGDKWYSQPFYSKPGGYKLCLNVMAQGDSSGTGTHVSVYVYLMMGEYDDWLEWPFRCNVTYGILNWKRNQDHVIRTVHFSSAIAQSNSRVSSGERAVTGWGYSQFLAHSSMFDNSAENIQYLQQDCLCLEVLKVECPEETDVD